MTSDELHEAPAQRHKDWLLDRRLVVLDLPELKAELKADIHGESAHLSKWMAATAITMVIGFGGMILTVMSRLPHA
jgi:hypothetical protein